MVTVPVRNPAAVGVNVTEKKQVPPAASVGAQTVGVAKSPVCASVMPVIELAELFTSVTDCAVLVVPTTPEKSEARRIQTRSGHRGRSGSRLINCLGTTRRVAGDGDGPGSGSGRRRREIH